MASHGELPPHSTPGQSPAASAPAAEHGTAATQRWLSNLRWLFPVILLLCAAVNYIDRTNVAIAQPLIERSLGLSPSEYGILLSAFFWPYAVANLPAGWLVDRLGPRRCVASSLICWSVVTMLTAAVMGFAGFIVLRVALAIAEAPFFAAATKACTRWFPARERGRAIAMVNLGTPIGMGIAPPVVTVLMLALGWRWMFVVTGLVGLVLAAVWSLVYRGEPGNHPWVGEQERERINRDIASGAESAEDTSGISWSALLRKPTMWAMVIGAFGVFYAGSVYMTWMPAFLREAKGFTVAQVGAVAVFPYLMGFLGMLTGGWWSDRLVRRGTDRIRARKIPIIAGALLATATMAPAAIVPSATLSVVFLGIGDYCRSIPLGILWTLSTDVAPRGRVASVGTIQNGLGSFGSASAPVVTGFLVEWAGYVPAFLVASVLTLVSAVAFGIFVRRPMTEQVH